MRIAFLLAAILFAGLAQSADVEVPAAPAPAAPAIVAPTWEETVKAATARAVTEKKDVLVILGDGQEADSFKTLLSDPAFATEASDCVVLSRVKEDAELSKILSVKKYPVFALIDTKGRPYAVLEGFVEAKSVDYLNVVKTFRIVREKRDTLLQTAEQAKGAIRATLLHAAMLSLVEAGLFQNGTYYGYEDVINEIVALDSKNEGKLKSKWGFYAIVNPVREKFTAGDMDGAAVIIDKYAEEYKTSDVDFAQKALFVKAHLYYSSKDVKNLVATLSYIRDLGPTTILGKEAISGLADIQKQIDEEIQRQQQEQPKQDQEQPKQ